ncbi:M23 family metallopeptidase [Acetanaerobacterium elongatum]|uniref:Peptidase family M23 n=1 Tax=Acetanaerobacterium elongatum TaxID=258515 RepID=A0A1H0E3J3_9FIRM|nr:M23 family metallopeptidase [Acetanaerobacterium elongatum]SDN76955.1 Peptidase family M23 [Acetanaerobacterium elongatum]
MSRLINHKKNLLLLIIGFCIILFTVIVCITQFASKFTFPVDRNSLAASAELNFTDNYVIFPLKADTNVYAALDGTVSYVGSDETTKTYKIVIDHANGLQTVYSALDENRIKVSKGDNVKKGSTIATIAANVNEEKNLDMTIFNSCLKFDLLKDSKAINPSNALHIYN